MWPTQKDPVMTMAHPMTLNEIANVNKNGEWSAYGSRRYESQ
jgi:hypothetical protein